MGNIFFIYSIKRARELGKGAIGGIISKLLRTGTVAEFNPSDNYVKIVKDLEEL